MMGSWSPADDEETLEGEEAKKPDPFLSTASLTENAEEENSEPPNLSFDTVTNILEDLASDVKPEEIDPGEATSYGVYVPDYDLDIDEPDIKEIKEEPDDSTVFTCETCKNTDLSASSEHCPTSKEKRQSSSAQAGCSQTAEEPTTSSGITANPVILFECYTCLELLRSVQELKDHIKTHDVSNERKQYSCDDCGSSYTEKRSLIRHVASQHREDKSFTCNKCGHHFSRRYNITRHLINNICGAQYSCKECPEKLIRENALKKHQKRRHKTELVYECKDLDKLMQMRKALMGPMDTYRDTIVPKEEFKKFTCDICQKGFKLKGNLGRHKRSHTGEKPFDCEGCGKKYRRKEDLLKHKRSRTC